ncbi:hypothetical protein M0804_001338 [Polistes exclamans]|nr:hypothetical protein M0804_001338 [Polistes exclamans]
MINVTMTMIFYHDFTFTYLLHVVWCVSVSSMRRSQISAVMDENIPTLISDTASVQSQDTGQRSIEADTTDLRLIK